MRLPVGDIIALGNSLEGLLKGGNAQIVRRNSENELAVIPFKLSADVYQWATTMLGRLHDIRTSHATAMQAIFKTISAGSGAIKPGTPEMMSYTEQEQTLFAEEKNFRALMLPLSALKLDDNPGIAAYLDGLRPVLKMPAITVAEDEPEAAN